MKLKKLSTLLLLIIIFLQTFSSYVMYAEYLLNKEYITSVFCINKAKPKLQCEGKCYLTKKLKEQRNQEQQTPSKVEKFDIQPYFLPKQFNFTNIVILKKVEYYEAETFLVSSDLQPVFHPPTI